MPELQVAGTSPAKRRPALKLVKTQALSRDQWLDVRKGGIGMPLVLAVRRWFPRNAPRTTDPSVIEGEFTVVPPRPRAGLPHPE